MTPEEALTEALTATCDADPHAECGGFHDIEADAILAALSERGYAVAPAAVLADGEALARLTPTEGHVVIFIDPGPKYRAVVYDPDGRWNEDEWQQYPTLAAAVAAALDEGGE